MRSGHQEFASGLQLAGARFRCIVAIIACNETGPACTQCNETGSHRSAEPLAKSPEVHGVHVAVAVGVEGEAGQAEGAAKRAEVEGIDVAIAVCVAEEAVEAESVVVATRAVAIAVEDVSDQVGYLVRQ